MVLPARACFSDYIALYIFKISPVVPKLWGIKDGKSAPFSGTTPLFARLRKMDHSLAPISSVFLSCVGTTADIHLKFSGLMQFCLSKPNMDKLTHLDTRKDH